MQELYRIHLFTWKFKKKEGDHSREEYRDYCLKNNWIGFGWSVSGSKNLEDIDAQYQKEKAYRKAKKMLINMKEGDLCWTRGNNGRYYLGKIFDNQVICQNIEGYPRIGLHRRCVWKEFSIERTPGKAINCLIAGSTLQHIDSQETLDYSNFLYDNKHLTISQDNFWTIIHPDDLEDLLGLYLQKKGYVIIPSTNKKGTELFEYLLIQQIPPFKRSVIQCKMGNSTISDHDLEKFKTDYQDYDVYLTVVNDNKVAELRNKVSNQYKNIKIISKQELFNFAQTNIQILPKRIQDLIGFVF